MYVCLCHAVTENDVRSCMADGACTTARQVKEACGMKPGCGSCTRRLYSLVSEVRTANELVDAIVGPPMSPVREVAHPVSEAPAPPLADEPMVEATETSPAIPVPGPGAWRIPTSRWLDDQHGRGAITAA